MINVLNHAGDVNTRTGCEEWRHRVAGNDYIVRFWRVWPGDFVAEINGYVPFNMFTEAPEQRPYKRFTSRWGMPFVRVKAWRELKKMVKEFS